ncbi:MAG: hypothetical protein JNK82_25870 [Myxococcaceae bacterium]|nr:hypothetical protein [Myxococcaceae bacterium]
MARAAALALALLALSCGPKSMAARREHSQRLADDADEQLGLAENAMRELDAVAAEKALKKATKILKDPDAQLYPEYEMLASRAKEDEAKLPEVRRLRELKELQTAIAERKAKIEEAAAAVKKSLKALEAATVEKATVDDAVKAGEELAEAVKAGADYEKKDKAFADWLKGQRDLQEKAKDPIALAKARIDFMEGPAVFREKAAEQLKAGKASKVQDEKRAAFVEAKRLYEQCQDACRKLLVANPAMSRLAITASGKKTTPEALDTACSAEWQDVDKAEKKLKPPKKKK